MSFGFWRPERMGDNRSTDVRACWRESMTRRRLVLAAGLAFGMSWGTSTGLAQKPSSPRTAAPINQSDLPSQLRPEAKIVKGYVPPRTPWGDPQISGAYTNSDESGIPFERPAAFEGRRLEDITSAELGQIVKQRQDQTVERAPTLSEFPGATSPLHWFENYRAANSRAWLVTDPPDGHVPPALPEATSRAAE